jgi:hypothetical protein
VQAQNVEVEAGELGGHGSPSSQHWTGQQVVCLVSFARTCREAIAVMRVRGYAIRAGPILVRVFVGLKYVAHCFPFVTVTSQMRSMKISLRLTVLHTCFGSIAGSLLVISSHLTKRSRWLAPGSVRPPFAPEASLSEHGLFKVELRTFRLL